MHPKIVFPGELAPLFEEEITNSDGILGDLNAALDAEFGRSRAADADNNADDEMLLSFQQALEEGLLNDDSWLE